MIDCVYIAPLGSFGFFLMYSMHIIEYHRVVLLVPEQKSAFVDAMCVLLVPSM